MREEYTKVMYSEDGVAVVYIDFEAMYNDKVIDHCIIDKTSMYYMIDNSVLTVEEDMTFTWK